MAKHSNTADHPDNKHDHNSGRTRDRDGTESRLLAATREMVERDGILAGLNLREVADRAKVNRGLIYQYFGSRQKLLRTALGEREWFNARIFTEPGRYRDFQSNRRKAFEVTVENARFLELEILRVLDRDPELVIFLRMPEIRKIIDGYQRAGSIRPDLDALAVYLATSAMFRGYALFREVFAKEAGLDLAYLDRHVGKVFEEMIMAIGEGGTSDDDHDG